MLGHNTKQWKFKIEMSISSDYHVCFSLSREVTKEDFIYFCTILSVYQCTSDP